MISSVVKRYTPDIDTEELELTGYAVTLDDGKELFVPLDESNRHYQEVLQWVADGNTIGEPE